jgi:hypothetical protein
MQITFTFFVEIDAPAGPDANMVQIERDYDTLDADHAHELALREWPSIRPARYIDGTLNIN